MLEQLNAEHDKLRGALTQMAATADRIAARPQDADTAIALYTTHRRPVEEVLPYEAAAEGLVYPGRHWPG